MFDPLMTSQTEQMLPVPALLKKKVLPWTLSAYREYPFGYSLIQKFISRRFSIHFWHIHMSSPGRLYPVSEKPTIAIHAMLMGDIPCILAGFGEKVLRNSRYELFYVPVSTNEAWLESGTYESFHVELEDGFLENIAQNFPTAKELLLRFNNASDQGIPMISVIISYVAKTIIKNIHDCQRQDGDLIILLHRYIVDLLSEYITGIRDQEEDEKIKSIPHKKLLVQIKEEIQSDPNIVSHELRKLSKRFGLSITELKKGFKALFNHTPGSFVRYHALKKAHYLITTTPQTIDEIAEEAGYGYRSNFDKAFKKQFGYAPASLR